MDHRSPVGRNSRALIIIDLQFCFLPDGALATTDDSDQDASKLIAGIAKQVRSGGYESIYITKDTHTYGHASFANASIQPYAIKKDFYESTQRIWNDSRDQVMWTPHCVCDRYGSSIDGSDFNKSGKLGCDLPFDIKYVESGPNIGYVSKGFDPDVDSYSAIADARGEPTPLLVSMNGKNLEKVTFIEHLNKMTYDEIDICGIARDKCVLWTALDLLEYLTYKPTIRFLYSLTRPVASGLYAQNLDITAETIESMVSANFPGKSETFHVVRDGGLRGGRGGGRRGGLRRPRSRSPSKSHKGGGSIHSDDYLREGPITGRTVEQIRNYMLKKGTTFEMVADIPETIFRRGPAKSTYFAAFEEANRRYH
jgi:nicotinamidase/pyrazinamidase